VNETNWSELTQTQYPHRLPYVRQLQSSHETLGLRCTMYKVGAWTDGSHEHRANQPAARVEESVGLTPALGEKGWS
jgi:hypothetical protein